MLRQQHAGNGEEDEAGGRHQAQTQREGWFQRALVDAHAVQVQEEVVEGGLRLLALRFRHLA
jgi:hypothetical protein